jgi:hypothetical protein
MLKWLMDKLSGKKTIAAALLLGLHQVVKYFGVDLTDAQLSQTIDVLLAVATAIFMRLGQAHNQSPA